jgi:hypothetical protein
MTMSPEKTKFAEIRFEIERILVKVQLAEGEDRRLLLRRLRGLIAQADEAISSDRRELDGLRSRVKTATDGDELNRRT